MSTFAPPPTGPGQPPPTIYPPGSAPPPLPTASYPPGTQPPPSSTWKYALMGCAVVFLIAVLATAGTCYYAASHTGDLARLASTALKPMYLNLLTPDHTPEQRENFSRHFDSLFQAMEKEGIKSFSEKYSSAFEELQQITQDQKITVEESEKWCAHLDAIMSGQQPNEKPDEEKGEDVPL
jgi:hypothetical protein